MRKDFWRHFFVPNKKNNYRPNSLEQGAVLGMMFLILISFAVANLQSFLWITSDTLVSTILPSVIVEYTNEERDDNELPPLRESEVLSRAAQLKADDMAKGSYFAHYSPDGRSPWYWFEQVSYNYVNAGENLAVHFTDSSDVVEAWMNSPAHRDNILNDSFSEIGVGAAEGTYEGFSTVFVVQLFGTAAEASFAFASEPEVLEATSTATTSEELVVADASDIVLQEVAGASEDKIELTDSSASVDPNWSPAAETQEAVDVTSAGTVVYSTYISTSTGGIPATIDSGQSDLSGESTVPIIALATKPHLVLQIIYVVVGLLVFVSLILAVFIEIRRQSPVQIAYGVGLLSVMVLLFYIHISLTSGALVI